MTKGQTLILLLIIALLFYYLTEDKTQPIKPNFKKPLAKNLQPTKSTYPLKPQVEVPTEPTKTKWPSDFPILECPSSQAEPANFGLNPPRSELNQPSEEPIKLPPTKIEELLSEGWPAHFPTSQPETTQPPKPSSTLTPEEQLQRQTQELSDYHWLLNHRTIDYWHYEHKLTETQYQALLGLVSQEEMNTLSYFLNLLPVNHEWLLISPEFQNQTLINKWKQHFTKEQTNDWLKIGLKPTDYALAAWLKNAKNLTAEAVLNFGDFEELKKEFTRYGS